MLEQSDLLQFIVSAPPDDTPVLDFPDSPAALLEAIFDEKTAGSISSLFDLMDVAEAEIDAAMRRRPDQAREIYNSFGLVGKGDSLTIFNNWYPHLFRGHCRELINRVADGEDTRPGTMAEILIQMSEASQRSPMNNAFNWAFFETFVRFFDDLMGQEHETITLAGEMIGHYAGLGNPDGKDEVISFAARKLTVPERVLPAKLKPVPPHRDV